MALSTYIDATYKEPIQQVLIGDLTIRNVLSIQRSEGEDAIGEVQVTMASSNSVEPEDKIIVLEGYNDFTEKTFTGIVDSIEKNELDGTYTVNARDPLKKAMDTFLVQEVKFGVDVANGAYYYSTYSDVSGGTFVIHKYDDLATLHSNHPETVDNITEEGAKAHAVVQWLLLMAGFSETGGDFLVRVDDTNFFIGDLKPARFYLMSIYEAIQQIADLIGWRIFADQSGVARFKVRPRNQSSTTNVWSYNSVDSGLTNVYSLRYSQSNLDLRNYLEVHGNADIKYVTRASSPYLGSTPYRGVLISNELIDTQAMAEYVGDRVLNDLNRLTKKVSMEVDGNPYLRVNTTVSLKSEDFTGKVLIKSIESRMSTDAGYKMSVDGIVFVTGSIDVGPAPEVVANIRAEQVISIGDPTYVVKFSGEGSYSNAGPIVSWSWSLPYSQTATGSTVWCSIDSTDVEPPAYVTASLTVTDSKGNTGTTSIDHLDYYVLASGVSSIKYRRLYAALTDRASGSYDSGATWIDYSIPAISVAASNFAVAGSIEAEGYALFGTTDGKVYKTTDVCRTMTEVSNPGDAVTHCSVAELDSRYALYGTDAGEVYASTNSGESWTLIGSFGATVLQARYAYENYSYVMVLTTGADSVYETFDLGTTWSQIFSGTGRSYLWNDAGTATNYFGHQTGLVSRDSSGVVEDISFAGVGTVGAPQVAVTVEIDDDAGVMSVGATNVALWSRPGDNDYDAALVAYNTYPNNKVRHEIRDGEMPNVVWLATQSGVYKSLDRHHSMLPLYAPTDTAPTSPGHTITLGLGSTGFGEMVAYGPLHEIAETPATEVLVPGWTGSDSTGPNVIYHYSAGTWSVKGAGQLPARDKSDYIYSIDTNPFNSNEWYVWLKSAAGGNLNNNAGAGNSGHISIDGATGTSPLWYTNDNGATFSPVLLNTTFNFLRGTRSVRFHPVIDGLALVFGDGEGTGGFFDINFMWWWVSAGAVTNHYTTAGGVNTGIAPVPSLDGFALVPGGSDVLYGVLNNNASTFSAGGGRSSVAAGYAQFLPGTRTLYEGGSVGVGGNLFGAQLRVSSDYRSGSTSNVGSLAPISIAVTNNQALIYTYGNSIYQLSGTTGLLLYTPSAGGFSHIATDNQTRLILAGRNSLSGSTTIGAVSEDEGITWTDLALPSGVTNTKLYDRIYPLVHANPI